MHDIENEIQPQENGGPSNFVRQGSLRKVIPGELKSENIFLNQKKELNQVFRNIHLEYIILAEYKTVMNECIDGVYVIPSRENFLEWFGVIFIRHGLYEDGIFRFNLIMDPDFPNSTKSPNVYFHSKMYHPAVNPDTNELNTMQVFPKWDKSENHIWQVLKFIYWIFYNVEESLVYAVNREAAYVFKHKRPEFTSMAKSVVAESSEHLYDEPPTADKHYIIFEPFDHNVHEAARAQLKTQKHDDFFKLRNSWVLPGTLTPLSKPPNPDSDEES